VIQTPDVFKSPASDTYIIFGEAKIEDLSGQQQQQAAEQFAQPRQVEQAQSRASAPAPAADDDDGDEDTTGVEQKDIELVMTQASVSRSKAIKALKSADGDIVSAIMELTM
jgi:nascent polypeptide-associated complex subunit alpha